MTWPGGRPGPFFRTRPRRKAFQQASGGQVCHGARQAQPEEAIWPLFYPISPPPTGRTAGAGGCGDTYKFLAEHRYIGVYPGGQQGHLLTPLGYGKEKSCCLHLCTKQQFRVISLLGDPE